MSIITRFIRLRMQEKLWALGVKVTDCLLPNHFCQSTRFSLFDADVPQSDGDVRDQHRTYGKIAGILMAWLSSAEEFHQKTSETSTPGGTRIRRL